MTRANIEQQNSFRGSQRQAQRAASFRLRASSAPASSLSKLAAMDVCFALDGIDEEGLTDAELDARMRSVEGALHGLPEGSCLYQYVRVISGFELPRQKQYVNPVTQVFADDRLTHLERTAGFRRIDLHWCLTLEPPKIKAFEQKPKQHTASTSRMLADLEKTATILVGHLGGSFGLRLLDKNATFHFFSDLFNLGGVGRCRRPTRRREA